MRNYELFADGSGNPSTRRSGWGYVLQGPDCEIHGCGYENKLATNRMELLAIIRGLQKLPTDERCKVTVYTDSLFVIKGRLAPYKPKQPTQGLWPQYRELVIKHDVCFVKVGSGNQHPVHRQAHNLAREAVFNLVIIEKVI